MALWTPPLIRGEGLWYQALGCGSQVWHRGYMQARRIWCLARSQAVRHVCQSTILSTPYRSTSMLANARCEDLQQLGLNPIHATDIIKRAAGAGVRFLWLVLCMWGRV
jgi:hypothetical protein